LETTFTAHWLAIEGTQPKIIQNPVDMVTAVEQKQAVKEQDVVKVKQTITQELQLYYEKITECIVGDEIQQQLAIESISTDPGIQPLMPYFTQFVNDTVNSFDIDNNKS
jgi:transcription initiation factor TFIID subunit 6